MSYPELTPPSLDGDPATTTLQICSFLCCLPGVPMVAIGTLWFINKKWGKGDVFKLAEAIGGKELADSLIERVENPPLSKE